jgi:hypothetical protein
MRVMYLVAAVAATASVPLLAAPDERASGARTICKFAKVTGSRLGRERICLSKVDWDLIDEERRKSTQQMTTVNAKPAQ